MEQFKPFYLHSFSSNADIISEFGALLDALDGAKVLLAYYHVGSWGCDSSAFVLYAFAGKLYEVHGCHCSCYGLEDQWDPEETTIEALEHRLDKGSLGSVGGYDDEGYADESRAVIDYLKGGPGMLPLKYYGRPVTVPVSYRYTLSFTPRGA